MNAGVVAPVISQHAEEASFLWLLRSAAVNAPHYTLRDLAELDTRVEAHLDGLRIAGTAGWDICRNELAWEEPGEVFVAGCLAFANGDMTRMRAVLDVVQQSGQCIPGVISALGWLDYDDVSERVKQLLSARTPDLRRIGIAAMAIHRRDVGADLASAIDDDESSLRAAALRAAGQLGRADCLSALVSHLEDPDAMCRFWAAWSAVRMGEPNGLHVLRELAESGFVRRQRALDTALRAMPLPEALRWQSALASNPELARQAVIAAGVIGDPSLVPWLFERMASPELARVAGEAFTLITGVDLALADLDGDSPDGFEPAPTDDIADESVDVDPDIDLPWPDPEALRGWWNEHQADFRSGERCLLGKPPEPAALKEILRLGFQRQRAAAAMQLALSAPKAPLYEIRSPGFRQRADWGV